MPYRKGKYTGSMETAYDGEKVPHGFGRMVYQNGLIFEGQFKKGERDGYTRESFGKYYKENIHGEKRKLLSSKSYNPVSHKIE